jgi:D-alanyl-D-alanine carboxypeptidase
MKSGTFCVFCLFFSAWFLGSCRAEMTASAATLPATSSRPAAQTATAMATPPPTTSTGAPATPTAIPTAAPATATATATTTATATATATLGPCTARLPEDDLLILVNREYGLSRDYTPGDLVPLADYFLSTVYLGYPTEVRAIIIDPLQEIIAAMQAEGMFPLIISGYRSYSAQALALEKWLSRYPDWATNLSAPPGHSEHQLGTTVDFGSLALPEMVGEEGIQFHPAFAQTREGKWLAEHAPEYGFTMSYPADSFERTEFYYEPWHFRYVGVDVAVELREKALTISEYLLQTQPEPCLP